MSRELYEQQGIKPTANQTSTNARIAAIVAQLRINSLPRRITLTKREKLLKNEHGEETG